LLGCHATRPHQAVYRWRHPLRANPLHSRPLLAVQRRAALASSPLRLVPALVMADGAGTRKRKCVSAAGGGASSTAAGGKKRAAATGGAYSTAAGIKKLAEASIGWIEVPPTSGSNAHTPCCCLWCRMAPSRGRRTLAADLAPSRAASLTHSPSTFSAEYTLTPWSSPASSPDHAASTPSEHAPSREGEDSPKEKPSTPSSYAVSAEQTRTPWNSPASSSEYASTPSSRVASPEHTKTPWNSPVSPDRASSIPSRAASLEFAPWTPPIRSAASPYYTPPALCNSLASSEFARSTRLARSAASPDYTPPAPCNSPVSPEYARSTRLTRSASLDHTPPAPVNSPAMVQSWVLEISRTPSTQWSRAGSPY
jgi:hypothetical protein